jgi:hypothetical protein
MKLAPTARKTKLYHRLILLVFCLTLATPAVAQAAQTNASYYAIYCTNKKNDLSVRGGNHALLDCGSSDPKVEATVKSLHTNPKGAHPVSIVEADCYPDEPTSTIKNGHIKCSNGPPATLTLGSHFAASKKAASKKKPKKKSKKKSSSLPTSITLSPVKPKHLPRSSANSNTVKTILNVVFGIIGAFAFLSMVLSGLKYVTSAGEPGKTSEAKKGIIFALVGLMLAITAEAIVAFVIHWGAPGP